MGGEHDTQLQQAVGGVDPGLEGPGDKEEGRLRAPADPPWRAVSGAPRPVPAEVHDEAVALAPDSWNLSVSPRQSWVVGRSGAPQSRTRGERVGDEGRSKDH